jgi:hypothetical protein
MVIYGIYIAASIKYALKVMRMNDSDPIGFDSTAEFKGKGLTN